MKNTGEQFILENSSDRLKDEHLSRYNFALEYAKDKMVLDIACGTGYGSNILAGAARQVVGVDVSAESVDHANKNFQKENLSFIRGRAEEVNFEESSFDLICSFETLEHLEFDDRKKFITNLSRWLKPDGLLILSTPNKRITSPFTDKPLNKHHVLEFERTNLEQELESQFKIVDWYGQRFIKKYLTFKSVRRLIRLVEVVFKKEFNIYSTRTSPNISKWSSRYLQPRIFVVMMKKI